MDEKVQKKKNCILYSIPIRLYYQTAKLAIEVLKIKNYALFILIIVFLSQDPVL